MTAAPRTLDDLAALGPEGLERLYHEARAPKVSDMEGRLVGRMLALPALHSLPVMPGLLRWYARSPFFPWQGKTFKTLGAGRGEGINRVLGDRRQWYRFRTFVGPSRAGAFDAVQLDYDAPENPWFIRAIKDEAREAAPGLWLGLAYLMVKGSPRLALYFGLAKA